MKNFVASDNINKNCASNEIILPKVVKNCFLKLSYEILSYVYWIFQSLYWRVQCLRYYKQKLWLKWNCYAGSCWKFLIKSFMWDSICNYIWHIEFSSAYLGECSFKVLILLNMLVIYFSVFFIFSLRKTSGNFNSADIINEIEMPQMKFLC